jgi:hypothetical protein
MSYTAVKLVLESDLYKGPTKAVLVALAHHFNARTGSNEVWPGYARLQRISGYSRSVVKREIDRLIEYGIVEVLSEGVGSESTHYLVYLGKLGLCGVGETPVVGTDEPHVGSERPRGVGSERPPNREVFNREGSREAQVEEKELASAAVPRSPTLPASPEQTSGTSSPNPCTPSSAVEVAVYFGGLNGDANSFAGQLAPFLRELSVADLKAIIDFGRNSSFWEVKIRTPKGFITCLQKGGIIDQWRNPPRAKKHKPAVQLPKGIKL